MLQPSEIRVLLAEDHAIVRDGLESLLTYQGFQIVAAVENGALAVEIYKRERPDVVLMDLRMPQMGGVEAIATIRAENPAANIVVLTTYSGDEDIHRALKAGARGYLLKDATKEELVQAILTVAQGGTAVPGQVASKLVDRATGTPLTPRETEILSWIAKGKSNKEIANELTVSEGTVKTHVNSLLEKLNASDRTDAVVIGHRRGLIHLD